MLLFALQSCNKTYVKEIVPEKDNKQEEKPVIEDDEITRILKKVEGVSDVQIMLVPVSEPSEETKAGGMPAGYAKQYFFNYAQPLDHNNPMLGSFNQQVAIQLTDLKNPVVVHTQGYNMDMKGSRVIEHGLITLLNANWVEIEFRYFGNSQPEAMDNVDFTYLYSEQSACDIHDIVVMLKEHVFNQNNRWLATGTSKGGITSALHAYYADQKGWKDFDVYVPFCAPFLPGTASSPLDASMGKYIFNGCGAGYQAGSTEAVAYANLQKILRQSVSKTALRNALLQTYHALSPDKYQTIMAQFKGAREEYMLAGVLNYYMENLVGRFAYIPFRNWAPLVPDPDLIQEGDTLGTEVTPLSQVVNFVFMGDDDFKKAIEAYYAGGEGTKAAIHTVDEMLALRNNPEYFMAYSVASVRELGCVGMDFSWLPAGAFLTPEVGYAVEELATGRARDMDYYEGQWDGGKLMTAIRNWVYTTTQNMVFVYGSDDPWTGGAIDDAAAQANAHVVKVMNAGGIHNHGFYDENFYTREACEQIQTAVKNFLK